MTTHKWGFAFVLLLIAFGPVLYVALQGDGVTYVADAVPTPSQPSTAVADDAQDTLPTQSPEEAVATLLASLPETIAVSGRTVTIDNESVATSTRAAYAALPYTVMVASTTQTIVDEIVFRPGENVLAFITRIVRERTPRQEVLAQYGDEQFQTAVSVYTLPKALVSSIDEGSGVSVYVTRENLPDARVRGRGDRFDMVYRRDGGWEVLWHGEQTYCQTATGATWQQADQLCQ